MNGSRALAAELVPAIAAFAAQSVVRSDIVLCPPASLLSDVAARIQGSFLALGAQDCSAKSEGAYTGEVSAQMLAEIGCRYVIVGHSERREYHAETDALVAAKAAAAIASGLVPVICVGETLAQREAGKAMDVVASQLKGSTVGLAANQFLLAYEPVWAIGSGKIAQASDIEAMHQHIASLCAGAKILYGGSVKAASAAEIMAVAGVSGVLVGGASLKSSEFCGIIAAAEEV